MSDTYSILPSIFSDDPRTGTLSYPQLEARRKIAIALATRNRPYPKTIGEGLTALGEGLGEGLYNRNVERAEVAQSARDAAAAQSLSGQPAARPAPGGASLEAEPATKELASGADPAMQAYAMAPPDATESQQPQMPLPEFKRRLARNESSISKTPYTLIGEESRRGDYPYGKYQVMGENIPKWTKKYLGKEMTPQEFLADPDAQEKVADGQGGYYLSKYNPTDAAAAWFAGEKGMNDTKRKDTLGTHVAEYKRRFNIPLVSPEEVVASAVRNPNTFAPEGGETENAAPFKVASLGGMPTPDTAPDLTRDAVTQSLVAQQGVQPPSPVRPQQIAQAGSLPPPPQQVMPSVIPQTIPPAPAQPARPTEPGPEPKLRDYIEGDPRLKAQMDAAKRIMLNPDSVSPHIYEQAKNAYAELEKRANDAFMKQWTVWHEDTKAKKAFELGEEERKLQTAKLRGETEDAATEREWKYRFGGLSRDEGFKLLQKDQVAADLAVKVRNDNRVILQAVRDGVIMGTGTGWRVNAAKLASWALQNGYASEQAANTEIARAMGGSRIRESLSQVNPVGVASNTDLLLARQLSGTDPVMEPKSFLALLHKSSLHNARLINEYEDKVDHTLTGTRAHKLFNLFPEPTAPQAATDAMLANRDDKALRAKYDDTYGEGSSALEIDRFNRRQKRGQ
jgi:hypothetical protein